MAPREGVSNILSIGCYYKVTNAAKAFGTNVTGVPAGSSDNVFYPFGIV